MSTDNPWLASAGEGRGTAYQQRLQARAAEGDYLHGEADLVETVAPPGPLRVLDAGCGTGRVAVELAARGHDVTGVDLDPSMLDVARGLSSQVSWLQGDLSSLDLDQRFSVVVAAGNVMVFLTPGTESLVVQRLAVHLLPGGLLVAGFALREGPSGIDLDLADYDAWCAEAGLTLHRRLATWEGEPYAGGTYAVSIHRRAA